MLDVAAKGRWETRVDGLGTSELKPDIAAVTLWGSVADFKPIAESYRNAAASYGMNVFEVGFDGAGFGNHLVIRFYSSTPYTLMDYSEMKFETESACESAATATRKALEPASKPVVTFCEESKDGRSNTLHVTSFEATLEPVSVFKAVRLSNRYATLGACQKSLQDLPSVSGAFGAVCAGIANDFRIHLFSRP
jgi:hypothetical protein